MKKRILAAAVAALVLIPSLAACEQIGWKEEEETPPFPVTAVNVTIEKAPRAVGSLTPSLTKLLIDLGYQDRIVGYSDDDVIPDGVSLDDLSALLAEVLPPSPEPALSEPADDGEEPAAPAESAASEEPAASSEAAVSSEPVSSGETEPGGVSGLSSGEGGSSEITISIPEDWDGKTPLPKEPAYIGRMGTALEPDLNAIGILKPEIVFTSLPMTKAQMDRLDAVNIKVVVLPAITTLDELYSRILDIVALMDGQLERDSTGRAMVEEMKEKLAYIQSKAPVRKQSFLYFTESGHITATGDTWESEILSLLGENLAAGMTGYTLTDEELAGLDPDVLLYSAPVERAHLEQDALLAEKTAVAAGSLIELDRAALMTQTRAVVETVRTIAKQLYPGVDFAEPPPPSSDESGAGAE